MLITFQPIQGETPSVSTKKLPQNNASVALNCDLDAQNLKPVKGDTFIQAVSSGTKTIYKLGDDWLQWSDVVDVARSFVTDSGGRIAFTGSGYPKETNTSLATSSSPYPHATRRLGIDAPDSPLTITISGTPGDEVLRTTSYVYTRIGTWSDGSVVESAPSPPTATWDVYTGETVNLSGFANSVKAGAYVTGYRLYRLSSGTSSAEFQFLDDITLVESSFADDVDDANVGTDVLATTTWTDPVETLAGMVSTTHGFLAGFSENKVYFSEVYIPYSFPSTYALPTESNVVGIGFNGSSVVAMTETHPYLFVGQDPATLSPLKINYEQSCVSARSIVNVPNGVIYATPDGLFFLDSSGQGKLFTDSIYTYNQWHDLNPETIFAFRYNNSYLAFFEGSTEGIEFLVGENTIKRFDTGRPVYGGFYAADDDILYLIMQNSAGTGRDIVSWRTAETLVDYDWWSKTFVFVNSLTLSVGVIQGDFTDGSVDMKIYCDGVLVATKTVDSDGLVSWPPVRCNEVTVKLQGKATIEAVTVASSAMEIYHV